MTACQDVFRALSGLLLRLLVPALAVTLALRIGVLELFLYSLEIFPPLFYLLHVLLIAYDPASFPEYRAAFARALDACPCLPRGPASCVVLVASVLGAWAVVLAYFVEPGAALFASAIALGALWLDVRRKLLGVRYLLCFGACFLRRGRALTRIGAKNRLR